MTIVTTISQPDLLAGILPANTGSLAGPGRQESITPVEERDAASQLFLTLLDTMGSSANPTLQGMADVPTNAEWNSPGEDINSLDETGLANAVMMLHIPGLNGFRPFAPFQIHETGEPFLSQSAREDSITSALPEVGSRQAGVQSNTLQEYSQQQAVAALHQRRRVNPMSDTITTLPPGEIRGEDALSTLPDNKDGAPHPSVKSLLATEVANQVGGETTPEQGAGNESLIPGAIVNEGQQSSTPERQTVGSWGNQNQHGVNHGFLNSSASTLQPSGGTTSTSDINQHGDGYSTLILSKTPAHPGGAGFVKRVTESVPACKVTCTLVDSPELQGRDGEEQTFSLESNHSTLALAGEVGPHVEFAESSERAEPLGSKIVQQIVQAVEKNMTVRDGTAEVVIQLDPPELGRVRIHVSTSSEGLSVTIMVGEEQTRLAVETQLEYLQERLAEVMQFIGQDGTQHQQRDSSAFCQEQQQSRQEAPRETLSDAEENAFAEAVASVDGGSLLFS